MSKGAFDVTRKISLAQSAKDKWRDAAGKLINIEPVIDAHVDQSGQLRIRYDASVIGIQDIETLLDELGLPRKADFWWKLKLAWFSYVDNNAQANARSNDGACCNRPPSAYGGSMQQKIKKHWHIPD